MKILVIGQGGREHALVWKLKQSPKVSRVYCAPGNGGIGQIAELVPYKESQVKELMHFVKEEGIDFTIIGPENPLLDGIVNQFEAEGLRVYGPSREAALIEGSKAFAKDFMQKYKIPTASYEVFTDPQAALSYVQEQGAPIVVKADGLAAGKGVLVAKTVEEAKQAIYDMLEGNKFGEAGRQVVIEECLQGEELSLMAFVDGETVLPMVPAQDHKAVYEGDQGPNTGGMGAYSPVPHMSEERVAEAVENVLRPAAQGLVEEGRPFTGILYAGLMITKQGAKVIEFNARFGDPETQVVLPRLETDLVEIIEASFSHRLAEIDIQWSSSAALTVVLASEGYPGAYQKGKVVTGTDEWLESSDVVLFHAGTKENNGQLVTSGGRVLGVTGLNQDLAHAKEKAYHALSTVQFEGRHYRRDIGDKAR